MNVTVNVLVLNYNGRTLLEKYLPSLAEAVSRSKFRCRLGVIDNRSNDDSVEYLKKAFPGVDVHEAKENRVLCSYNDVAASVREEIVLFMNNDIRVEPDFIDPLVEPFRKDPETFFVTPRCLSMKDGSYEGSRTRGRIRFGVFWSSAIFPGHEEGILRPGPTFAGGFGAFDRKKFLELDGYDDLYLPGRLEDADLCFRAQRKGWKCLYAPQSVVYHEGGTSFHRAFGVKRTLVINWRNTFLFMVKNLGTPKLVAMFFFWLPLRLIYSLVSLKPEFALGYFQAMPLFERARERRRATEGERRSAAVGENAIFARV
jgi:N-acetylglucosaminyl-diphospho-decaprenol L-rhamnosyltransferase